MFMPHLDQFRGSRGFPETTKIKADTKFIVVLCCQFLIGGPQQNLAAVSGGGRGCHRPQTAAGMVSFLQI